MRYSLSAISLFMVGSFSLSLRQHIHSADAPNRFGSNASNGANDGERTEKIEIA